MGILLSDGDLTNFRSVAMSLMLAVALSAAAAPCASISSVSPAFVFSFPGCCSFNATVYPSNITIFGCTVYIDSSVEAVFEVRLLREDPEDIVDPNSPAFVEYLNSLLRAQCAGDGPEGSFRSDSAQVVMDTILTSQLRVLKILPIVPGFIIDSKGNISFSDETQKIGPYYAVWDASDPNAHTVFITIQPIMYRLDLLQETRLDSIVLSVQRLR